jgi:hypothetical protein
LTTVGERRYTVAMNARVAGCALLLSVGCGYPLAAGPKPLNVEQPTFNQLWFYAAQQLDCPSKGLVYEQFGEARHLFKGCGKQIEMIVVSDHSSMSGVYTRPAAANRYSKEVNCDIHTTKEEAIDNVTRVVDGCGQRITYVFNCNYADCTWVANVTQK